MIKRKMSGTWVLMCVLIGLIVLVSGCCSTCPRTGSDSLLKSSSIVIKDEEPKVEEPVVVAEEVVPVEEEVELEEGSSILEEALATEQETKLQSEEHVVKKGECLWWIAEYEDIYNDPFMWPLIYDANKNQIDDPDLIYPDQILRIPRSGYSIQEIEEARGTAGAPRPYVLPADTILPTN